MRGAWAAGAALLFICGTAQADETNPPPLPEQNAMAIGIGVICNTTEQAERYVRLRADGAELSPAMNIVNEEAQDPQACGLAAVAFERDKTMDTATMNGKLVSIVRINVVAGYNGHEWLRVPATTQYAVVEDTGGIAI
jgi:hypothetical protein